MVLLDSIAQRENDTNLVFASETTLSKRFRRLGFTWFCHAYASPTFSNLSKIIAAVTNVCYSHQGLVG
jgi:hypothetical protein